MGVGAQSEQSSHGVAFHEAVRFWVKLGFINFGGPTGQIALMHSELVERRRWISNERFLHALNYCMLLPGPEAQQLAIYVGWLLHKARGGLVAGITFILPSFFLMLGLSWIYAAHGDVAWVSAVFAGLAAAVVGIVGVALIRVGKRALKNGVMIAVAIASFVCIFLVGVPFPLVVIGAGLLGFAAGHARPSTFAIMKGETAGGDTAPQAALRDDISEEHHTDVRLRRTILVLIAGLAAWLIPLLAVSSLDFGTTVFRNEAFFFSKAALVTFGGAYAVLAYMNQAAVLKYGWLTQGQMVTGLGLAESTPGPLIMVTEFVGFLGAYKFHGSLSPVQAGALGAVVTVWATFAPCFLWIFLGAPFIEKLRGNVRLTAALSTITAAVVGVIASLALTFGIDTLFNEVTQKKVLWTVVPVPQAGSFDVFALLVAAAAFIGIWRFKWNVVAVVGGSALAGLVWMLVTK